MQTPIPTVPAPVEAPWEMTENFLDISRRSRSEIQQALKRLLQIVRGRNVHLATVAAARYYFIWHRLLIRCPKFGSFCEHGATECWRKL